LFSACCEIGAIQAEADESTKSAMRNFGLDLGIAFQLADDLLDLTGDAESLGKDAGADLLEGKLTLPLIKLVEAEPEMRGVFERIMLDGNYDSFSRDKIRLSLETAGIIDDMKAEAQTFLRRAKKSLDVLPETQYRSALEAILNFIIERNA
jgi:octaprenyl-diphosphate synthase